ncbi:uncharacterized protein LOC131650396 [Vicia villosa]|uniref:uncharacterized protein LOC131650396 n=1 Tax=Vicia villosa TaxID=3911 RepID=UPI00273C8DA9|nr:uncharacterized protein LOC131650396 [Vicia villosa]
MIMFRRGALAAAFNRLCEVSCKSADDYKEALEGMNSLCEKRNKINEVNINGKSKANDHVADDPITVKTKGAPKNKKSYMKPQKHCSHCRKLGHTRRRCPILAGIDFTTGDEGEGEDSHVESDYESSRLNESISHEMNEETHYSSISNSRYNTDDNIGIKRNREKGHTTGFSTQDSGNQKTSSLDRKTENNGTPRGFGYGVSSSVKHASQNSRWNHGVGYASNYFPMYSGIPTLGGSMFPQFPSTSIPTFYSNNIVLGSETNDAPSNGSFMSVLKDMESSAKHHKS